MRVSQAGKLSCLLEECTGLGEGECLPPQAQWVRGARQSRWNVVMLGTANTRLTVPIRRLPSLHCVVPASSSSFFSITLIFLTCFVSLYKKLFSIFN